MRASKREETQKEASRRSHHAGALGHAGRDCAEREARQKAKTREEIGQWKTERVPCRILTRADGSRYFIDAWGTEQAAPVLPTPRPWTAEAEYYLQQLEADGKIVHSFQGAEQHRQKLKGSRAKDGQCSASAEEKCGKMKRYPKSVLMSAWGEPLFSKSPMSVLIIANATGANRKRANSQPVKKSSNHSQTFQNENQLDEAKPQGQRNAQDGHRHEIRRPNPLTATSRLKSNFCKPRQLLPESPVHLSNVSQVAQSSHLGYALQDLLLHGKKAQPLCEVAQSRSTIRHRP